MRPEKLPKRVLSAGVAEGKRASGATGRRSRSVAKETKPLDARRVCFLQEEAGCKMYWPSRNPDFQISGNPEFENSRIPEDQKQARVMRRDNKAEQK